MDMDNAVIDPLEIERRLRALEAGIAPKPLHVFGSGFGGHYEETTSRGPKSGTFFHQVQQEQARRAEERRQAAVDAQMQATREREDAAALEAQRLAANAPRVARLRTERKQLFDSRKPHLDRAQHFTDRMIEIDDEIKGLE